MDDLEQLLEKYYSMHLSGRNAYFDVEEIVVLINYFFEQNDIDNVNAVINIGLDLHPNDYDFHIAISEAIMDAGYYESAQRVLGEQPVGVNDDVDMLKIECLLGLDKYDEAMAIIDFLHEKQVSYFEDIIEGTASALNENSKFHLHALHFIRAAMKRYPDNFNLKIEHCYNYELRGEMHKALELCQELVDLEPFSADAWYMFGRLHSICLNLDKAIEAFDFAIAAEEKDKAILYEIKQLRAFCLMKNSNYEKAILAYEELLTVEESNIADILPFMAKCYMELADYEHAYTLLEAIVDNEDVFDEVGVTGDLIICCLETERREEALELLCEAMKKYPQAILGYMGAADYFRAGMQPDENEMQAAAEMIMPEELRREFVSTTLHYN